MIVNIISEPPSAQTAYPAFRKTPAGVHSGEDQPLGVSLAKNSGANQLLMIGLTELFPLSGNLRGEESRIEYSYRLEPYG